MPQKLYRSLFLIVCFFFALQLQSANEGRPFVRNFSSDEYHAHNRNMDIIADGKGNVFVANFEGLMYYDGVQFRILHTPGISRLTKLLRDKSGRLWFGGYNVFGFVTTDKNGRLQLNTIHAESTSTKIGEVTALNEIDSGIEVVTMAGNRFIYDGKALKESGSSKEKNNADASTSATTVGGFKVNHLLSLPTGEKLVGTEGGGVICIGKNGERRFVLNRTYGLCSDNVTRLSYDGNGRVWGATDNGIFCISYPSAFTHISETEGLKGEVLTIAKFNGKIYVGTSQGLFVNNGESYVQLSGLNSSCWQLATNTNALYAATATGLYRVNGTSLTPLTTQHTLSVLPMPDGTCLVGELKGVCSVESNGKKTEKAAIEHVTKILPESDGTIFLQDIYGHVYKKTTTETTFTPINAAARLSDDAVVSMFEGNNGLDIISNKIIYVWDKNQSAFIPKDTLYDAFDYPQSIFNDPTGYIWFTDNTGKNVTPFFRRVIDKNITPWLQTMNEMQVTALLREDDDVLFGGKQEIVCWKVDATDPSFNVKPAVFIREITLGADSVVWGGYADAQSLAPRQSFKELSFSSRNRTLTFTFSTAVEPIFGDVEYRYRINDSDEWSEWSTNTTADFVNLSSGNYTFEVQARDCFGRTSEVAKVPFRIAWPWYLRWWSILFYLIALAALVYGVVRWRMQRLLKEKARLEGIVDERTAELRQQKEQVEEKSASLEHALNELEQAQNTLVRQEKMATVGKLTKGLIDRILNPINYINNFSNLSAGLADDLLEDIDEDKENITPEIYDDLKDVTSMIRSNLSKVVEHGTNASRVLKAMEEMLKERVGKKVPTDIAEICRQDMEILGNYFKNDIEQYNIQTQIEGCDDKVEILADASSMSKSIMSVLVNAVYAVKKKYAKAVYAPQIRLRLETTDEDVLIRIFDNGIGIEDGIKDEIFAPFFTTKTTAEAAGVGLYLAKETFQAHDGDISVESVKDEYTEFTIKLKKV